MPGNPIDAAMREALHADRVARMVRLWAVARLEAHRRGQQSPGPIISPCGRGGLERASGALRGFLHRGLLPLDAFQSVLDYAVLGAEAPDDYEPRPTARPTDYPPGSPGKVAVLAARVVAGEDLWHPDDRSSADEVAGVSCRGG